MAEESGDATHEWFTPRTAKWEACRRCGNVRRADRMNKPCKGDVFVSVRQRQAGAGHLDQATQPALDAMHQAYRALMLAGWQDIRYAPKDGTTFRAIEPGSTGIHDCFFMGDEDGGGFWGPDAGDLWPMRPILFKLKPN